MSPQDRPAHKSLTLARQCDCRFCLKDATQTFEDRKGADRPVRSKKLQPSAIKIVRLALVEEHATHAPATVSQARSPPSEKLWSSTSCPTTITSWTEQVCFLSSSPGEGCGIRSGWQRSQRGARFYQGRIGSEEAVRHGAPSQSSVRNRRKVHRTWNSTANDVDEWRAPIRKSETCAYHVRCFEHEST